MTNFFTARNILLLVLAIFAIGGLLVSARLQSSQPPEVSDEEAETPTQEAPEATVSLVAKEDGSVAITAGAANVALSGITISLTYQYNQEPLHTSEKVQVNPVLIENGWSFPVNRIAVDETSKTVSIELAAINLSPAGAVLGEGETIGTIAFTTIPKGVGALRFDTSASKVITKDGREARVTFNDNL